MKLKVCGLKYKENIEQVAVLQPDYMGFIFYPKSKRFVGEDFQMPDVPSRIKKTGVFVNSDLEYVKEKVTRYNLDVVQLHGNEDPGFCGQLKPWVKVVKAFGLDENFDFKVLGSYKNSCDYFLFDTKTNEYGGSGKQFNWDILKRYDLNVPFFLSGGIGLDEMEKITLLASRYSNLYAIDVNSRFEIEPGLKDINKLNQLTDKIQH